MIIAKSPDGRTVAMISEYGLPPLVRSAEGVWGTGSITGEELSDFITVMDVEERLAIVRDVMSHSCGWQCFSHKDGSKSAMSPDGKTELFWKPSWGITGSFDDEERMPPPVAAWLFDFHLPK